MNVISMLFVVIRLLVSGSLRGAMVPMVKTFAVSYGPVVLDVARDAVFRIAESAGGASGEEKRKQALVDARKMLIAKGVEVADSVLNMAIEAGVQKLKKS